MQPEFDFRVCDLNPTSFIPFPKEPRQHVPALLFSEVSIPLRAEAASGQDRVLQPLVANFHPLFDSEKVGIVLSVEIGGTQSS